MTYYEFMLAFCGENRIDKADFEKNNARPYGQKRRSHKPI